MFQEAVGSLALDCQCYPGHAIQQLICVKGRYCTKIHMSLWNCRRLLLAVNALTPMHARRTVIRLHDLGGCVNEWAYTEMNAAQWSG